MIKKLCSQLVLNCLCKATEQYKPSQRYSSFLLKLRLFKKKKTGTGLIVLVGLLTDTYSQA